MTDYAGIDYGMGTSNIDTDTGIRYGVISQYQVGQWWYEENEPYYGEPRCPKCGGDAKDINEIPEEIGDWETAPYESAEFYCPDCEYIFGPESAYPESPIAFTYDGNGYQCEQSGNDTDIFITKSPYFTYAQFCSPCAPGAVHLSAPLNTPIEKNRGYCFGHDWFNSGKAPYPVYDVKTGKQVKPENV